MSQASSRPVPQAEPPDFDIRPPKLKLPQGSCDCHAHVFGPASRFPYAQSRIYTPAETPVERYLELLSALGVSRAVLVQPSPYGTDNRALLAALAGRPNFRGVAALTADVSTRELEALHGAGVRGIRFNVVDTSEGRGVLPVDLIRRLAARIRDLGWHIELLAHVNDYPDLDRVLKDLPVPVVFGHVGYVATGHGTRNDGFRALMRLMRDGRAWAKLSGPYRISPANQPFADVTPFAHELIACASSQVVWGTDWPHIKAAWQIPMPNDADLVDLLSEWVPDPDLRYRVLVDNPTRLYSFAR